MGPNGMEDMAFMLILLLVPVGPDETVALIRFRDTIGTTLLHPLRVSTIAALGDGHASSAEEAERERGDAVFGRADCMQILGC